MFTQEIELRGHIIDSLTLPKVLDLIRGRGGHFRVCDFTIGEEPTDPSYARIEVSAESVALVESIIGQLRRHGAEVVAEAEATLVAAPTDGVFPAGFYVTSNQPTFVHRGPRWLDVQPVLMDCGIVVDESQATARAVKFSEVQHGMQIVTGHRGIRTAPATRPETHSNSFAFMASHVSSEKPKALAIRELAAEMRRIKQTGQGKILIVAGPALIHTGGGPHLERLVEWGYVDVLFAGNALAVHDIEQALYGTSLGMSLAHGGLTEEGHENHMHAINTIRAAGGIIQAVDAGVLTSGVMYRCVQQRVPFVLAGSIRDDGPLPEVITDAVVAQRAMRAALEGVVLALMMGSMLHAVAVGNLLPARVKTFCVDINPAVVTKLTDRGTFQAVGLVTDIEPFLRTLTEWLDGPPLIADESEVNHDAPAAVVST